MKLRLPLAASLALSLTGTAALAEQVSFPDMVPADTILVAQVPDVTTAKKAFFSTPLGDMWQTDEIKQLRDELLADADETLDDLFTELDFDSEQKADLVPGGMVGLAVSMTPIEIIKEEDGSDNMTASYEVEDIVDFNVLLALQYPEHADLAEDFADALMDKWADDSDTDIDEEDYNDTVIRSLIIEDTDNGSKLPDAPGSVEDALDEINSLDEPPFGEMYFTRVDDFIIFATGEDVIKHAIDAIDGEDVKSLSGNDDYLRAVARFRKGSRLNAVLLLQPLFDLAERLNEVNSISEVDFLQLLGVKNVNSLSLELFLNNENSMVTQRLYTLLNGDKKGLLSLIKESKGPFAAPDFVNAETAKLITLNFDFPAIPDMIDDTLSKLPEEQAATVKPGWDMNRDNLASVFDNLGPRVDIISWFEHPYSAESPVMLAALDINDPEPIIQNITSYGVMFGIAERDFQGHRVFDNPQMPVSVGFGLGKMFIGKTAAVEQVFRNADGKIHKLTDRPDFRTGVSILKPDGTFYAFDDILTTWDYTRWALINSSKLQYEAVKKTRQSMKDQGVSDDDLDKWMPLPVIEEPPAWTELLPERSFFARYLGPAVSSMHLTDDGFELLYMTLPPLKNN